ncbi:hypothetical protein LTR12_008423 [Friedmanniomyces endolithicus]|nr:hypothetical protein LTR74_002512 [Friedmanniomyces endolithicus]KAK1817128.1 hypothetical protein LTR12_008423 [Friedmanniomyces endolithicus]
MTILAPAPSAAQPSGAAHRKAGEEDAFVERSELMEVYEIPLSSIYRATEQGNPAMTIDIGQVLGNPNGEWDLHEDGYLGR